jgi:nucleoside 2-deoxyribosyltransferase
VRDRPLRVIYIAGPYRGPCAWDIECNIRRAETLALDVWRAGAVALCPHANTRHFQGAAPDDVWLRGDLELLDRCDAMILTDDWERSAGARAEVEFARRRGIPVFPSLDALRAWLEIDP